MSPKPRIQPSIHRGVVVGALECVMFTYDFVHVRVCVFVSICSCASPHRVRLHDHCVRQSRVLAWNGSSRSSSSISAGVVAWRDLGIPLTTTPPPNTPHPFEENPNITTAHTADTDDGLLPTFSSRSVWFAWKIRVRDRLWFAVRFYADRRSITVHVFYSTVNNNSISQIRTSRWRSKQTHTHTILPIVRYIFISWIRSTSKNQTLATEWTYSIKTQTHIRNLAALFRCPFFVENI